MKEKTEWSTRKLLCPEGQGDSELLLQWVIGPGGRKLTGVHCPNPYLSDFNGGKCEWGCWPLAEE